MVPNEEEEEDEATSSLSSVPRQGCCRPCDHAAQVPAVLRVPGPSDSVPLLTLGIPVVSQRQVPTVHSLQVLLEVVEAPVVVQRQVRGSLVQKAVVVPQSQFFGGRQHPFHAAEDHPHGPVCSEDRQDSAVAVRFLVVDVPVVWVVLASQMQSLALVFCGKRRGLWHEILFPGVIVNAKEFFEFTPGVLRAYDHVGRPIWGSDVQKTVEAPQLLFIAQVVSRVLMRPSWFHDRCRGPDSAGHRLEIPLLQFIFKVVDFPVVAMRLLSCFVHGGRCPCCADAAGRFALGMWTSFHGPGAGSHLFGPRRLSSTKNTDHPRRASPKTTRLILGTGVVRGRGRGSFQPSDRCRFQIY